MEMSRPGPSPSPRGRRSVRPLLAAIAACVALLASVPATASAVEFGLHFSSDTQNPTDWEALDRSGINRYELNATWGVIQKAGASIGADWKHEFAWTSTYDKSFELAARKNITILPVFYGRKVDGPSHHRFYGEWEPEWSEWFRFVWTFVQRYGHGGTFWASHPGLPYRPVDVWEIWNEPNLAANNPVLAKAQCTNPEWEYDPTFEVETCVQPQNYARFMVATVNTIKNAQAEKSPTAPAILSGGLFREPGTNPGTVSKFLNTIKKNATLSNQYKNSFQALSIHPYSYTGATENEKLEGFTGGVFAAYSALNSYLEGGSKGIWITEMGWPVEGPGAGLVSEAEQAELLRRSFNWITTAAPSYNITVALWYFYRDQPISHWAYHTGLRREDGSYRPAWFEFLKQTGAATWPVAPNLRGVLMNGAASKKTEVHILSGTSNYGSVIGSYATALAETSTASWQFSVNDYDGNGSGDLFAVSQSGTGTKKTELHVLDGSNSYSTFLLHAGTALAETTPAQWMFSASDVNYDGKVDLVGVMLNGTGSGKTEVHVLDGATNYSTFLVHAVTPLPETTRAQWQYSPLDYNADGKVDVIGVKVNGTGSGKSEAWILDGASGYTTYLLVTPTAFGETTQAQSQFWGVDYNGDGYGDLMRIQLTGTGSKKTEVHVLNGKGSFASSLTSAATPWGETKESANRFAPSIK